MKDMISLKKVQELFESIQGSKAINIEALAGGMVGMVFKITLDGDREVVFKLNDKHETQEEHVDGRVYGSNQDNLSSAYEVLKEHNIATFDRIASGETQGYHYAIFSLLGGEESNPEIIKSPVYAQTLARIHSISRDFQGWACKNCPYETDWKSAFTESIYSRLSNIYGLIDSALYTNAKNYIGENIVGLKNPDKYVFSHLDGLQAIFHQKGKEWKLSGVIDIEDYQFTDQRFVLSGITLGEYFNRYKLPEDFWVNYESILPVDKSYKQFEALFQVYYVLVWIMVHNDCGNKKEQKECEEVLSQLIS